MRDISDNDLKAKGIAVIESHLDAHSLAFITADDNKRFVVMDLEQYRYLRECELEVTLSEIQADLNAGRVVRESPEAHLMHIVKPE